MGRQGNRATSRRGFAGLVITLALHGGLFAAIALANNKQQETLVIKRDFVVAEMVKLGKPRDKFWLPRLTQPARSTAAPGTIELSDGPECVAGRWHGVRP